MTARIVHHLDIFTAAASSLVILINLILWGVVSVRALWFTMPEAETLVGIAAYTIVCLLVLLLKRL